MAIAEKHVGEDVYPSFNIEISTGVYRDLDAASDIFVTCSNGANTVKFTKNPHDGYANILTRVDRYNYMAIITSAHTNTLDVGNVKITRRFEFTSLNGDLSETLIAEDVAFRLLPNKLQTV